MENLDLKGFRESFGFSQEDLATALGVTRNTIINWESGKSIPNARRGKVESYMKDYVHANVLTNNEAGLSWHASKLKESKYGKELIPFFDIDFFNNQDASLENEISKSNPAYYMDVPEFAGCYAFQAHTEAMVDVIKPGSILFVSKKEEWWVHLELGQIYWIVCKDGSKYLRYIRRYREDPSKYFMLFSENKTFDEFEIPKESIQEIWLVQGHLSKRV